MAAWRKEEVDAARHHHHQEKREATRLENLLSQTGVEARLFNVKNTTAAAARNFLEIKHDQVFVFL